VLRDALGCGAMGRDATLCGAKLSDDVDEI
jgi:hypothetical protein